MFCRKGVLRNFAKFTGKQLCQSLFFNKVAGLGPAFCLKKRIWHRCFPVNFVKFFRTPFLQTPFGDCFFIKLFFLNARIEKQSQLQISNKLLNKELSNKMICGITRCVIVIVYGRKFVFKKCSTKLYIISRHNISCQL